MDERTLSQEEIDTLLADGGDGSASAPSDESTGEIVLLLVQSVLHGVARRAGLAAEMEQGRVRTAPWKELQTEATAGRDLLKISFDGLFSESAFLSIDQAADEPLLETADLEGVGQLISEALRPVFGTDVPCRVVRDDPSRVFAPDTQVVVGAAGGNVGGRALHLLLAFPAIAFEALLQRVQQEVASPPVDQGEEERFRAARAEAARHDAPKGASFVEYDNLNLLLDVQLQVTVELGRTRMQIKELLALGKGSVIELDKLAGEPVEVYVNGKLVARGEVVTIDENFGVKITDIIERKERVLSLQ